MDEAKKDGTDLRPIIQGVIEEFVRAQQIRRSRHTRLNCWTSANAARTSSDE